MHKKADEPSTVEWIIGLAIGLVLTSVIAIIFAAVVLSMMFPRDS